jgi:hypothetical protein
VQTQQFRITRETLLSIVEAGVKAGQHAIPIHRRLSTDRDVETIKVLNVTKVKGHDSYRLTIQVGV